MSLRVLIAARLSRLGLKKVHVYSATAVFSQKYSDEARRVDNDLTCGQMADFDLSTSFIPSLHKPSSLLPIARHRQSLLYLVETFPVTIVVGQTGSSIPLLFFSIKEQLESHE